MLGENDTEVLLIMTNEPKNNDSKKKKSLKTILVVMSIILITLLTAIFIYVYPILENVNIDTPIESPEFTISPSEALEETEEIPSGLPTAKPTNEISPDSLLEMKKNEDYGITNIMVFGMDNRYRSTILGGRSDVNIILTLDPGKNEVRLTSIERDTLIYIPSQADNNRINTAIVYEDGPEGAIAAIEKEFLIDIDHYIITSFRGMIEIIDAIGGVEVNLSQNEVWDMNGLIQEMNKIFGSSRTKYNIQSPGSKNINGIQAVAYMRLRKTPGRETRDDRQKEVLASAKEKLKNMTLTEMDNTLKTVSNWMKTDLEPMELISLATELYGLKDGTYKAAKIPYDDLSESVRYKEMAVIQYDREPTLWKMHDFIYNGIE